MADANFVLVFIVAYALFGLMQYYSLIATHEAIHYGLWPDRKINDYLGWLMACLHTFHYKEIKKAHLEHHRALGQSHDPDYPSYIKQTRSQKFNILSIFLRPFASILSKFLPENKAVNSAKNETSEEVEMIAYEPRKNLAVIIGFHLAVSFSLSLFSAFLGIAWWAALITVPGFLMHVRLVTEHSGLVIKDEELDDRNLLARSHVCPKNIIDKCIFQITRAIIAPFSFNYHHEHHAMPAIPYYQLHRVHDYLELENYFADKPAVIGHQYQKTFRENFRLILSK